MRPLYGPCESSLTLQLCAQVLSRRPSSFQSTVVIFCIYFILITLSGSSLLKTCPYYAAEEQYSPTAKGRKGGSQCRKWKHAVEYDISFPPERSDWRHYASDTTTIALEGGRGRLIRSRRCRSNIVSRISIRSAMPTEVSRLIPEVMNPSVII